MILRLLQRHHLFTRMEEMEARLHTTEVKVLNAVALSEEMYDKAIHAIKRHEKRYKVEGGGSRIDRASDLDAGEAPPPLVDDITLRVRERRGLST
jgi:hypothetical protein